MCVPALHVGRIVTAQGGLLQAHTGENLPRCTKRTGSQRELGVKWVGSPSNGAARSYYDKDQPGPQRDQHRGDRRLDELNRDLLDEAGADERADKGRTGGGGDKVLQMLGIVPGRGGGLLRAEEGQPVNQGTRNVHRNRATHGGPNESVAIETELDQERGS